VSQIVDLAAIIVDCREAEPVAEFYRAACGGEIIRTDRDSAWLTVQGVTVIFREVEGYQPPTWPSSDVPMQIHLDFYVDDLDEAQNHLRRHGATTPEYQLHRENGLVVMLDPAGHPFCIGTRVQIERSGQGRTAWVPAIEPESRRANRLTPGARGQA
jgi:hypothetical protein